MTPPEQCKYDAVIIGGNTAGLVTAYVLGQFGIRTALIERSDQIGGIDASFKNKNGRVFDHGLHGLDYMRSELVTRLFSKVIGGRVNMVERRRGIVLGNHLIPYNSELADWPEALRAMFPSGDLVDGLGTDQPTRQNLARFYGREFTDMIFDDGLRSYPSDHHHLQFGIEESELVRDLYPWFFPKARRASLATSASRKYHDAARKKRQECVLYPCEGGFGAFGQALFDAVRASGVECLVGAKDLRIDIDSATKFVRSITAGGQELTAERVYWCAAPGALYELLGGPGPDLKPDRYVIGSFEFSEVVDGRFNEVILADPNHRINRMTFPGSFAQSRNDLVQVEFAFPRDAKDFEREAAVWREDWMSSLENLGIISASNDLLDFDFKTFPIFYNTYGVDGQVAPEIRFDALPEESNLRPLHLTVKNVNINTRLPQIVKSLVEDMSGR